MVINSDYNLYGRAPVKDSSFDIKRKQNKPFGFAFPLSQESGGGYLKKATGIELVKNNLRQLILTTRGERVMLPDFGTNLKNYLMEPLDQALLSQIRREILEAVTKYAANVTVTKLQVFPGTSPTFEGGHYVLIKLFCQLKEEDAVTFEVKVELF